MRSLIDKAYTMIIRFSHSSRVMYHNYKFSISFLKMLNDGIVFKLSAIKTLLSVSYLRTPVRSGFCSKWYCSLVILVFKNFCSLPSNKSLITVCYICLNCLCLWFNIFIRCMLFCLLSPNIHDHFKSNARLVHESFLMYSSIEK